MWCWLTLYRSVTQSTTSVLGSSLQRMSRYAKQWWSSANTSFATSSWSVGNWDFHWRHRTVFAWDTWRICVERRKCLANGMNRIQAVILLCRWVPFYTGAKLPIDDAEKFCNWCLSDFCYEDEKTVLPTPSSSEKLPGVRETIMMGLHPVTIPHLR